MAVARLNGPGLRDLVSFNRESPSKGRAVQASCFQNPGTKSAGGGCWAEPGPRGSKAEAPEAPGLPQPHLGLLSWCLGMVSHLLISGSIFVACHSCPKCPGEAGRHLERQPLKSSEIWPLRQVAFRERLDCPPPPAEGRGGFQGRGRCPTDQPVCPGGKPLASRSL